MMTDVGSIYLIRHGQASFGAENYDVLSPIGLRQAQVVGEHFQQLGVRLDRCLSGSLHRQRETANAALAQLSDAPSLEIDEAFNEFDADTVIRALLPELLSEEPEALYILRNSAQNRAEFQRLFAKLIGRWIADEYDQPNLQSWQGYVEQVRAGLMRVIEQANNKHSIAVFTSGGTITALLHLLTGIPVHKAFELNWQIVNTSLSLLKFRGSEVSLASFNSHAHLQLLKAPELVTYR